MLMRRNRLIGLAFSPSKPIGPCRYAIILGGRSTDVTGKTHQRPFLWVNYEALNLERRRIPRRHSGHSQKAEDSFRHALIARQRCKQSRPSLIASNSLNLSSDPSEGWRKRRCHQKFRHYDVTPNPAKDLQLPYLNKRSWKPSQAEPELFELGSHCILKRSIGHKACAGSMTIGPQARKLCVRIFRGHLRGLSNAETM
jgi:hypothetical protein